MNHQKVIYMIHQKIHMRARVYVCVCIILSNELTRRNFPSLRIRLDIISCSTLIFISCSTLIFMLPSFAKI